MYGELVQVSLWLKDFLDRNVPFRPNRMPACRRQERGFSLFQMSGFLVELLPEFCLGLLPVISPAGVEKSLQFL